jgi:heme oxygenase
MESDSVVAALRAATNDARTELVNRLDLPAITRDRYGVFLRASMAVVAPLEARIACWLGLPADGFCRTTALRSDLEALGAHESFPVDVPSISSLAEAMGAAYVVEGSALDGVKHVAAVARRLGSDAPSRFLSLRGERTAERWRQFVLSLEHWGVHAPRHARIMACESARATFAAYASAFAAVGAFAT